MSLPSSLTLVEAVALIRTGQLTSEELTLSCLERIETIDPRINAFVSIDAERAIDSARAADYENASNNDPSQQPR